MALLSYIANNFLSIIGLGGYVVTGLVIFLGLFNSQANARRKENDEITTQLINNLNEKVKVQDQEMDLMRAQTRDHAVERDRQISVLQGDLKTLQGRNSLVEDLLKGRDPLAQEVFKEAPEIFKIAKENNSISKANNAAITELTKTLQEFIGTLQHVKQ